MMPITAGAQNETRHDALGVEPVRGTARFWTLAGVLLICGLSLLTYAPALHGDFMLDDDRYLTNTPLIASADGLYRIWFTTEALDYWPMAYTSFWFEWRLWGRHPLGYHVVNLALHVSITLLLWLVLRRLSIPGAFLAALLFSIHPVNVVAVAWISQRKTLLAALFLLLSILCFLREEKRRGVGEQGLGRWYWLSLFAFLLAALSKISVVSMPLVFLLIVWWLRGQITRVDLLRSLPYFGISLATILVQLQFKTHGDPAPDPIWAERFAGAGVAVWFYLAKALTPIDLQYLYCHWRIHLGDLLWWLPLLTAMGVTVILGSRK